MAQKKPGGLAAARLQWVEMRGLNYLTKTDIVTLTVCPPGP
jgi:hypothetical protein